MNPLNEARRIVVTLGFVAAYCVGLFSGLRPFYYLPEQRIWSFVALEGIRMGYFSLLAWGAAGALLAFLLTAPMQVREALARQLPKLQNIGVVGLVCALTAIAAFELS